MKYFAVFVLAVCLCCTLALANGKLVDRTPIYSLPLITGNESLEAAPTTNVRLEPSYPPSIDWVGEVDTVGTTWYDYQHNGTAGRMIRVDDTGKIHVVWMNGLDNGATSRHIYYNLHDPISGWQWSNTGYPVENAVRGGYTCLGVNADGYPFPCFHVVTSTSGGLGHSATAADFFPGTGAFQFWELPYVYDPSVLEVIWPKIAVDIQGRIHVASTENPASGAAGDPQRVYYCRGTFDPLLFNITYQASQTEIEWTENITVDVAASRHSDRVALAYTKIRYIPPYEVDTTQYNNDVYLFISEDGITWDFNTPTNVTNFITPDPSYLPDTVAADRDTLRVYNDISLLFDAADNIHVAFTTAAYYCLEGLISINNSMIWHWTDLTDNYGLIVDGFWGATPLSCGAWQRFVQRPCLAIDEATGDLYCTYMAYDTSDASQGGFYQGEAFVGWSDDDGDHWSVATNITNTHAPNAEPGHCWSERDITCSEEVVDGFLHVLYVMDSDAGGIPQSEGSWTNSPVYYHKVPISGITQNPMVPRYPMHVDSTGFPPPYVTDVEVVQNDKLPSSFQLAQNYPNPFNPTTNIRFDLTRSDHVSLKVYNITGQEVATLVSGNLVAGSYNVPFDATNLASGVYFYKLSTPAQTESRKMVLLK
jgi:hypothetical protein